MRRALASAVALVVVAAAWVLFAPPQLGGQTSYVIVNGNSMEPGMHRGDLAVVRSNPSYQVGDVVTYRHPEIGAVIHRVIGVEKGRFVFQGDNNDFVDSYHASRPEVVGELWFSVPRVGAWMAGLHSPLAVAGVLFVAFVGLGGATAATRSHQHRRRRKAPEATPATYQPGPLGGSAMDKLKRNWQDTVTVLAALGIGLAALAWVSFSRPVDRHVPADVPYTQAGEFSYSAESADGAVYDSGAAQSGEPVYRRLSDAIAFRFDYRIESPAALDVAGTYHLVAQLGDESGWRRTIELTPETAFDGASFSAEGVLRLADVQELVSVLEARSGVTNDAYSLVIEPGVAISGKIGAVDFTDSFNAARLPLTIDDARVAMDRRGAEASPFSPRVEGMVTTPVSESNTVDILALSLPVAAVRVASVAGLGLLLVALGVLIVIFVHGAGQAVVGAPGGPGGTRLRSPLVNVLGAVPAPKARVIDVASLEDLGRIAERAGAVVLQEARPGYHAFFVHDIEMTYRFEAVGRRESRASSAGGRVA